MKQILIAGAGALGSQVVTMLAADMRDLDITVIDFDTVESRNTQAGTQFYYPDQIGLPKVEALQYNIFKLLNGRRINVVNEKITPTNVKRVLAAYPSLQVDCLDNRESRQIVKQTALDYNIPCLHSGFSPNMTFVVEWNEKYKVPDDNLSGFDICEAEGAASFIKLVASVTSSTIQEFLKNGKKLEFVGNRFLVRGII